MSTSFKRLMSSSASNYAASQAGHHNMSMKQPKAAPTAKPLHRDKPDCLNH